MSVAEKAISKKEERLLRAICRGVLNRELLEETLFRLRSYAFASVHHQVVFDCLAALARRGPETIRSLLPERLVRAGFPDLDIASFFESHGFESHGFESQGFEPQGFEPHGMMDAEARELLTTLTGRPGA